MTGLQQPSLFAQDFLGSLWTDQMSVLIIVAMVLTIGVLMRVCIR